jgi:hypothetical protein
MMSQTAARRVNVVALGFADDQGETEERPTPDPRVTYSMGFSRLRFAKLKNGLSIVSR